MNKISLREKNLIWAFVENYKINIDDRNYYQVDNIYEKLLLASVYGFDGFSILFPYLKYLDNLDKHKSFSKMFFLYLDSFICEKFSPKRPILNYYREEYFSDIRKYFSNHKRVDLVDELSYTLSQRFFSQVPKTTEKVRKLATSFSESKHLNSIEELIKTFDEIINDNFYFSFKDKEKSKGRIDFESLKKMEPIKKEKNVLDDYYGLIGSAEFTTELNLDGLERDEEETSSGLDKVISNDEKEKIIRSMFGKSILSSQENKQLELDLCKNIHKDNKIIITRGEYGTDAESLFRLKKLSESYDENLDYYNFLINYYSREAKNMERSIKNSMVVDDEFIVSRSKSGKLNSQLVYRNIYMKDPNIFTKEYKNDRTNFSIDILIDSSASQIDRKSSVASQAYTIANVFTNLSIPTRVLAYSNVENYLALKIFRDYNDEISKNKDIFNYLPTGSNRDGLALKLAGRLINENKYRKKLLIYLTDGKPNDVRQRVDNKQYAMQYTEAIAENDTGKEFRILEQAGIKCLAIFTGKEEDLPSMKRIYGNNFAYIKNLRRFSKIVTMYIKKMLSE